MSGDNKPVASLTLGAMGVVYGDIGTSPLYAFKECFHEAHGLEPGRAEIFGVLSLIFWSVMLVVTLKYVIFMMRADNRGEGGTLSLLTLATKATRSPRLSALLGVLGIFAPAISVLSAVEGLGLVAPALGHFVVPVTLAIICALFMIQRHGTASVGTFFGPVMSVWFAVLAGLGVWHIAQAPEILAALNPMHVVHLFQQHRLVAYIALGSVVLSLTGAEALYADMGHFGKRPIRIAWTAFVSPALVLNYFGQGALVLRDPALVENPLYRMVPGAALLPLIVLAALATVIASQAVISGAFSVTRQAFQLKLLPRIATIHTSASEEGQIYIPFINWSLFIAVVALVLGFRRSWNRALTAACAVTFIVVDLAFFTSNALKIPHGGWFPLVIAVVIFTLLTTWRTGRRLLIAQLREAALPVELFLHGLRDVPRVPGTAVFLTSNAEGAPPALLHNLKHNKVVHETVILLTVHTVDYPGTQAAERLVLNELGQGFHRAEMYFGYRDDQDVPQTLAQLAPATLPLDPMQTSYFLSRETLLPARKPGMLLWREHLFAWMVRNAATPLRTFHLPPNRVVELGQQITI